MDDRGQTEELGALAERVVGALERAVLGQRSAAESLLIGYMAGGHVLLEGVPGIGKTLLARTFAESLGLRFGRVQFTPDLMPADLIGTNVFDPATRTFRLVRGPVFTQVLMADEINRTPPKTQSALLEAMQERQVTLDGTTEALDAGFFVVATQNPVEFEGTYPLPEAQLDRFLLRVEMRLPAREAEIAIYASAVAGSLSGWSASEAAPAAMSSEEAAALRRASRRVHVKPELLLYLARLAGAVRASPHVELGTSPRGGLCLLDAARAAALLAGRDYALPDDLKRMLGPCWGHRILLRAESEIEGMTASRVLDGIASSVEVPR